MNAEEVPRLAKPIASGEAALVLGRRAIVEKNALPLHQRAGNRLLLRALRRRSGIHISDLSPFRAIRRDVLTVLRLRETTFGFPMETVAAALRHGFRVAEVDVSYRRRRHGESKVSGSLLRSLAAGTTLYRALNRAWRRARAPQGQVVVFARTPELGHVKTRLRSRLDDVSTLAMYRAFLRDSLLAARIAAA